MEIVLSNKQIHQIADKTAKILARRLKSVTESQPELVSVREAARLMGVSVSHMRSIKDDFSYVRRGKNQQGHIYFVRESLIPSIPKENDKQNK